MMVLLKRAAQWLAPWLFGIGFGLLVLETFSVILLLTVAKPQQQHFNEPYHLMDRFPAQLRMSAEEIRKEFPRSLPMQRTGGYLTFPFDPVLGFRVTDNLEWYGGDANDTHNKFFIVTFGGSTTVGDNWPKYLKKYAQKEKIAQELVVLNAGHMGYTTFNEYIYLTDWILPMLERIGAKRPDLVLTLDGANDVWTRIFSYQEYRSQQAQIWYSHYHGYHQHLDTDLRKLNEPATQLRQLGAVLAMQLYDFSVNQLALVIPYSLKTFLSLMRKQLQPPPSLDDIRKLGETNIVVLDEKMQDTLVKSFRDSLLDFHGVTAIRKIRFAAYLQPVLLDKYYPHDASPHLYYPNINFFSMNLYRVARQFTRLGGPYVVKTEPLYAKIEQMYQTLADEYQGAFVNITGVLHDLPDVAQVYNKDAIHYEIQAKERIAHAIIQDVSRKGILSSRQ
ncbi:MAG: SGNH/GDSL hydrolase family protein [Magnetococcales bacterium]|nr:SGNH/GDSL hydrolase family protein [Magnetococcales bacterium]